MPDYKKKKHKKIVSRKSKNDFTNINDDFEIKLKSDKEKSDSNKPRVIKGNKGFKNARLKFILSIILVFVLVFAIATLIFPVGISETFTDFVLSIGSGEYPIEISGSKVLSVEASDNYYYVLSDLNIFAVSNAGKQINSFNHGFSDPVLNASNTRALVYDQGQKTYSVFTLRKRIISKTLNHNIICAHISDSGRYAIATHSDSYSSTVSVYDKRGKNIFTWNCAKDLINSVTLSPNGKRLAVSTVNAVNGELSSRFYIFDIKKTDPQNIFDFADKTVYSISSNRKGVYIVSNSGYIFIQWSGSRKTDENTKLQIEFFRITSKGAVVVENRTTDRSDNKIILLNRYGQLDNSFGFSGNIGDIRQNGSHIYIISDAFVYVYNTKGEFVSRTKCDHDIRFILPTGSRNAALVSDSLINSTLVR